MALRDPIAVFVTLHTTTGVHFSVNAAHIAWIDHSDEPDEHHVNVMDGAGTPTVLTIDHAHWLELKNSTVHVVFLPDLSPAG